MSEIESSVRVRAAPGVVFDRFTRFEEYPTYMTGVDTVERDPADAARVRVGFSVGSVPREYTIEVAVDADARRLSWTSVEGPAHSGVATVTGSGDGSELTLYVDFHPHGAVESIGDALGVIRSRVGRDLRRFAEHVEHHPERPDADGRGAGDGRAPSQRLTDRLLLGEPDDPSPGG